MRDRFQLSKKAACWIDLCRRGPYVARDCIWLDHFRLRQFKVDCGRPRVKLDFAQFRRAIRIRINLNQVCSQSVVEPLGLLDAVRPVRRIDTADHPAAGARARGVGAIPNGYLKILHRIFGFRINHLADDGQSRRQSKDIFLFAAFNSCFGRHKPFGRQISASSSSRGSRSAPRLHFHPHID